MRLFSLRSCALHIHPLFVLMLLFLCLCGAAWPVAAFFSVLLLHEGAHLLCALKLKISISRLELTLFGGSMQIPLIDALPPRHAFILSSAGPVCNLLFLCVSLTACRRLSLFHPFLLYFIQYNAAMLCINLLPVLPLDGGRMLLALLSSRFSRAQILRILLNLGRSLSLVSILAGFVGALYGRPYLAPVMLGIYLLYAAAIEEKTGTSRYLASFMARRIRFEKQKTLPVHVLCASEALPVYMLISSLRPGAYHTVCVVDESSMHFLGLLHEDTVLSCLLDRSTATLGEILSGNQS